MNTLETLPEQIQSLVLEALKQILGIEDVLVARVVLAALLVLMAVLLLLLALRVLRHEKTAELVKTSLIPSHLLKTGTTLELYNPDGSPAFRCVLTRVNKKRLRCEVIERLGNVTAQKGDTIQCLHAPVKAAGKRVNGFPCLLAEPVDKDTASPQVVLSAPIRFQFIKRREHGRKRVVDQQFIRIKLWLADADTSDIPYADAVPDIGINSYAQDASGHDTNSVLNISKGGIALRISNSMLPATCITDARVVINIFMFNFREKVFKPYWYEGMIRNMESDGDGYTRIGISFGRAGIYDDNQACIQWQ